jgi:hypothetical protein
MVYTHCTPSCLPRDADLVPSLQMFSIKIAKIKHLQWPLHVYGTVAARDYVDQKRNIIFFRPRSESQTLTKNASTFFLSIYSFMSYYCCSELLIPASCSLNNDIQIIDDDDDCFRILICT